MREVYVADVRIPLSIQGDRGIHSYVGTLVHHLSDPLVLAAVPIGIFEFSGAAVVVTDVHRVGARRGDGDGGVEAAAVHPFPVPSSPAFVESMVHPIIVMADVGVSCGIQRDRGPEIGSEA